MGCWLVSVPQDADKWHETRKLELELEELKRVNKALQAKIASLEDENGDLKSRIAELHEELGAGASRQIGHAGLAALRFHGDVAASADTVSGSALRPNPFRRQRGGQV